MKKDLFENPQNLPLKVQMLLDEFNVQDKSYNACEKLKTSLQEIGYTFQFGLDAKPFNLQEIDGFVFPPEKSDVSENNKLIAEFMGWECETLETVAPEEFRTKIYFEHNPKEYFTTTIYKYIDCLFHSDWNWLMHVVEKIESLGNAVTIEENWCEIKSKSNFFKKERVASSKIEATYSAVVEFIKWYNQNKKQN